MYSQRSIPSGAIKNPKVQTVMQLSCPLNVPSRRKCRKQRSRPCSSRKMLYITTSAIRSVWVSEDDLLSGVLGTPPVAMISVNYINRGHTTMS